MNEYLFTDLTNDADLKAALEDMGQEAGLTLVVATGGPVDGISPGPWGWANEDYADEEPYISDITGEIIIECTGGWPEQMEANARLIAAAPDLLEALQVLIELVGLDDAFRDPEHEPDAYAALVLAREAVRRATEGGAA